MTSSLFYLAHMGWIMGLLLTLAYDKGIISYDALLPVWIVLSVTGSFILTSSPTLLLRRPLWPTPQA